jgi:hypothetical protein
MVKISRQKLEKFPNQNILKLYLEKLPEVASQFPQQSFLIWIFLKVFMQWRIDSGLIFRFLPEIYFCYLEKLPEDFESFQ